MESSPVHERNFAILSRGEESKANASDIEWLHRAQLETRLREIIDAQDRLLDGNRGDACTFIYKGEAEVRANLVTSFHCIHIERAKAKIFVWRARETAPGIMELVDFQFGGETAAHGVPVSENFAVAPLVN